MTGLDKILAHIQAEADDGAKAVLDEAKKAAEADAAGIKAQSDAKVADIGKAAAKTAEDILRAGDSAVALQARQQTLATKQRLLDETLAKALETLRGLPEPEYFALLLRLAQSSAEPGQKGEMLLGKKDLQRLPKGFEKDLNDCLTGGASLSIAKDVAAVDGGFVLRYGSIEQNCSFAAIFDARRDEFMDSIRGILFA